MAENNWTTENVNQALQELPALIARQTEIVADKEHELNKLKHKLEMKKARQLMKIVYNKSMTSNEKKSIIRISTEIEEMAVIQAKDALKRENIKLKDYTNQFESVKRFTQLRIEEMRHLE